jgi:broad specificity phosphatase PhoE
MTVRLTMVSAAATAAVRRTIFPPDEPLEERSLTLAAGLRPLLGSADRAWSSPTLRARQTAEALSLDAAETPALGDQDYGAWAGRSLAEIGREQPEALSAWLSDPDFAPPGGEPLSALARRVAAFLEAAAAGTGRAVAVTHPAVIRAAVIHVLGAPAHAFRLIDVEPLSLTGFSHDGRRWVLRMTAAARPGILGPNPEDGVG